VEDGGASFLVKQNVNRFFGYKRATASVRGRANGHPFSSPGTCESLRAPRPTRGLEGQESNSIDVRNRAGPRDCGISASGFALPDPSCALPLKMTWR